MNLKQKLSETALAIVPVVIIIIALHVTIAPISVTTLVSFIAGAVVVIFGLGIFLAGVDLAIVPSGSLIGAALTRTRNLPAILLSVFAAGFIITLAEPNLKVQGGLVESVTGVIGSMSLVIAVSAGLALFLALGMGRILLQIPYKLIIVLSYGTVLLLASRVSPMFVAIAFDSSGAATGPLTVPFFIALGLGVSSVRGGKKADDDSFGTTGIAAIGAIFAVTVLAFALSGGAESSGASSSTATAEVASKTAVVSQADALDATPDGAQDGAAGSADSGPEQSTSPFREAFSALLAALPQQAKNVTIALAPLAVLIALFQKVLLRMPPAQIRRIVAGLLYTWIGLVLFFTGANTGFIPAGTEIGVVLGEPSRQWILVPLGCVLGALIVCAEPAMWVLTAQVEEVSAGNIRKPVLLAAVAIGVACGVGLSMWRVIEGFSVWYLFAPAFLLAMALTFVTPKLFVSIAFDSGSVATGPVSSTLILPVTLGAALSSGGNPATDGFGLIAMIAVTPPISIQILGIIFHAKERKAQRRREAATKQAAQAAIHTDGTHPAEGGSK